MHMFFNEPVSTVHIQLIDLYEGIPTAPGSNYSQLYSYFSAPVSLQTEATEAVIDLSGLCFSSNKSVVGISGFSISTCSPSSFLFRANQSGLPLYVLFKYGAVLDAAKIPNSALTISLPEAIREGAPGTRVLLIFITPSSSILLVITSRLLPMSDGVLCVH